VIVLLLAVMGAWNAQAAPQATDMPAPATVDHQDHAFELAQGESVAAGVDRALASRVEVSCTDVLALGPADQVRSALVAATERALPPWAPLRAAGCLTELAASDDAALQHVQGLVGLQDQPGFALAVSERLHVLPEARAVQLATAALDNPAPALKRRLPARLLQSPSAPVRALVTAP